VKKVPGSSIRICRREKGKGGKGRGVRRARHVLQRDIRRDLAKKRGSEKGREGGKKRKVAKRGRKLRRKKKGHLKTGLSAWASQEA